MNTGENKKMKTMKIVRRMIVIRKGLELLQKFCLFLQNMNEKFVKMCTLKQGWGGLGKGPFNKSQYWPHGAQKHAEIAENEKA